MTILQSLDSYYHRLPGVAEPGWSREPIGFVMTLNEDGSLVDVEPWTELAGKKFKPRPELVPKWFGRSGTASTPFFLWDNSAYALGVSKKDGGKVERDHAAFIALHQRLLIDSSDKGLIALRKFLGIWTPDQFDDPRFQADYLDQNVVFRLRSELGFIHQRPAARQLVSTLIAPDDSAPAVFCLVTGERAPGIRLHPKIKNVEGTAAAEVPLVSFNNDSTQSYDKKQGENAPTSQAAAFRYGAALNHLLARDSRNRLRRPVGDATVVFWADASDARAGEAADAFMAQFIDSDVSDEEQAAKLRRELDAIAAGRPLAELRPGIEPGTRFHVFGLSPNAARLSVRFWLSDTLDAFAQRLARHHADLAMEPPPQGWGAAPSVNRLLVNTTALQREFKNIPPLLAGEVMRAVLSGTRYPQSLLSAVIIRLRAGDPKTSDGKALPIGWHAAVIRAVLVRMNRQNPLIPEQGETPMSLKRDHANPGYQLGRLFAVCEMAQEAALGKVNATIRDRYYGAASATPASVFPMIVRNAQNHFAKARKTKPGWANLIEKELIEINDRFEPNLGGTWPRSLRLQDQGEFAIGYYHQRAAKLTNDKGEAVHADDLPEAADHEGEE